MNHDTPDNRPSAPLRLTLELPQPCGCPITLTAEGSAVQAKCGCYGISDGMLIGLLGAMGGQLMAQYGEHVLGKSFPCPTHDPAKCPSDPGGNLRVKS